MRETYGEEKYPEPAQMEVPPGYVIENAGRIDKAIEELRKEILALEKDLSIITLPPNPQPSNKEVTEMPPKKGSQLSIRLEEVGKRIEALATIVIRIRGRLDL